MQQERVAAGEGVPRGRVDRRQRNVVAHDRRQRAPAAVGRRGDRERAWARRLSPRIAPDSTGRARSFCYHRRMHIAMAQLDQVIGDLAGNARRILDAVASARRGGAVARRHARALALRLPARGPGAAPGVPRRLRDASSPRSPPRVRDVTVVVGFPERRNGTRHNALALIRDGRVDGGLPQAMPAELHGVRRAALFHARRRALRRRASTACASASSSARTSGSRRPRRRRGRRAPQVLVVPNGSPYHTRQQAARSHVVAARARENGIPVVYVNRVGGQDELVFDGASMVVDADGSVAQQLPAWHETIALAAFDGARPRAVRGSLDARLEAHVWQRARDGRARLRRQERLPRRAAGTLGRHRLGAHAGDRGRRARRATRCAR